MSNKISTARKCSWSSSIGCGETTHLSQRRNSPCKSPRTSIGRGTAFAGMGRECNRRGDKRGQENQTCFAQSGGSNHPGTSLIGSGAACAGGSIRRPRFNGAALAADESRPLVATQTDGD